jgi:hypothetical protein
VYDWSENCLFPAFDDCWPDCCRFFHHFQASIPTPAIAALRILFPPKVSLRTWRLFLFPMPNMLLLLCGGAAGAAHD